jgi:hypothetical protein
LQPGSGSPNVCLYVAEAGLPLKIGNRFTNNICSIIDNDKGPNHAYRKTPYLADAPAGDKCHGAV